jgi:hypothetical protein
LFARVEVKTPISVIYQPILLGIAPDGIYVEAHADVYRKGGDAFATLRRVATEAGVHDRIDWEAAKQVLLKREGVARRVSAGS